MNCKNKIYIVVITLFLFQISSFCQLPDDISHYKASHLLGFSKAAERAGDFYSASQYLAEYVKIKQTSAKQIYRLANLLKKTRRYTEAGKYYMQAYTLNPTKYAMALYEHGKMLKSQDQYDSAIICFELFIKNNRSNKNSYQNKYLAEKEIKGCELGLKFRDSVPNIFVNRLNPTINKKHIESSPIMVTDSILVYSALRVDSFGYYAIADSNEIPFRQFQAAVKKSDSWQYLDYLPHALPFDNDTIDTGGGCFSNDKQRFYFTRCHRNWQSKIICQLYVSEFKGNEWSEPKLLYSRINLKNYTATQPATGNCYDKNLEVLYFVSDRPGGYGGFDIWYSIYNLKTKSYKKPVNAGGFINTPGNEITPFYDINSKTLFFSSDFWTGIGGYDIFSANGEMAVWQDVENIGPPFNSGVDDLYYVQNLNKKEGFFTSNRADKPGTQNELCCDDIFYYNREKKNTIMVSGTITSISGDIINSYLKENNDSTHVPDMKKEISHVNISLYLTDENNKPFVKVDADTTDNTGRYTFEVLRNKTYCISVSDTNYLGKPIHFNTFNYEAEKPLQLNSLSVNKISKKAFVIKNIYYEFGASTLTDSAKLIINNTVFKILNDIQDIKIEISSHTDNIGSEKYNIKLSQARAESVKTFLIENGISPARLIAKGYGETKPVAENTHNDGTDNPEGRKLNRRTEFKIIGKIDRFIQLN